MTTHSTVLSSPDSESSLEWWIVPAPSRAPQPDRYQQHLHYSNTTPNHSSLAGRSDRVNSSRYIVYVSNYSSTIYDILWHHEMCHPWWSASVCSVSPRKSDAAASINCCSGPPRRNARTRPPSPRGCLQPATPCETLPWVCHACAGFLPVPDCHQSLPRSRGRQGCCDRCGC
jgi:hypothetical protein